MKKSIMASKGTPQQFAAALQNKIAELGGGVEDINSSTSITASSQLSIIRNELSFNELDDCIKDAAYIETGDGSYLVVIETEDGLSVQENGAGSFVSKSREDVLNHVLQSWGFNSVGAATSITAASESYKDTSGIMGIPGEIWTTAELSEYWKNEQMDDPVMSEYDSFESWYSDTVSQMELIDASTSIKASEGEDSQYIQELAQKAAQQASEDSGWSVTHNIAGGMISFVVSDGTQQLGTYIQPIGEIYPDWAELDDDVQQLASEILGQIEPNMDGGIDPEVGSPTL